MKQEKVYLYGKNALIEALMSRPDVVGKVFLGKSARADQTLMKLLSKHKITISDLKEDEGKNKVGSDVLLIAITLANLLLSLYEDCSCCQ